jgi:hypothetical protein
MTCRAVEKAECHMKNITILLHKKVLVSLTWLIAIYMISLWLLQWFSGGNFDLNQAITVCKISSLGYLIITNHDLAIGSRHKPICAKINIFILTIVLFILIASIADIANTKKILVDWNHPARPFFLFFIENATYISVFPFIAFFFLDFYIYTASDSDCVDKQIASDFIVYSDVISFVPLVMVGVLLYWYSFQNQYDLNEVKVFFSGIIAILLLTSTLSASVLDAYHTEKYGNKKRAERDGSK